jgi:hypothetical protein
VRPREAAVDETAFRAAAGAANPQPCVFAKALQAGCAGCRLAVHGALAERETIGCASGPAHANCATLLALLRERCAFALRLPPGAPAPHAAGLKLQCGGIAGLRGALGAGDADVHGQVAAARERFGSLTRLPWPEVVAAVSAWQGRRRYGGRQR